MTSGIVITGAGVISALAAGSADFQQSLYAGVRAAHPSALLGAECITAEIPAFDPQRWLGEKGIRNLDRAARLACVAIHLALSDAGLGSQQFEGSPDIGIICGTMFGSLHSIMSFDWTGLTEGPQYVSPMEFPNTVIHSPIAQAAIRFKLRGVHSMLCAAEAASLYAIGQAAECLRLGRARVLLAGGVEELSEESFRAFRSAHVGLETIPGEGSAFLVLEPDDLARQRGAQPQVEIAGFGAAFETPSSSRALVRAIEHALDDAGISPDQITLIAASAAGCPEADGQEAAALARVFGATLPSIPVFAPKAAFGEALGASGVMCALAAASALRCQCVPPTIGWNHAGSDLRLSAAPQPFAGEYALINAVGSDGNSSALVLRRLLA